jgi:MHS family proline/betaine transporter-like MFS transporter
MLGAAVGAALSSVMSAEALAAWGWRVAFISGLAVAVVGVVIRRNMLDEPVAKTRESPLKVALRDHGGAVMRVIGLNMAPAATYYVLFVYAATWLSEHVGVARPLALDLTTATILTFLVVVPIAARASDTFGRKRVLLVGMTACLVLAYPLVSLMQTGETRLVAIGQMGFAGLLGIYMAAVPAAMCEMFPHAVRVSAVSVGYSFAYAIFGGTAPAISVWLIDRTGNDVAFAWYLIVVTAISLGVAIRMRERPVEEPIDVSEPASREQGEKNTAGAVAGV